MNLEELFCRPIEWRRSDENRFLFYSEVEGQRVELRLNDFPDEPLCTLFCAGEEMDFETLGEHWKMPWQ